MYETNSAGENARTDRDAPHDKKPDAHVLGRGETRVPDDDAVIFTDGGHVQTGPEPRPVTGDWPTADEAAIDSDPTSEVVTEADQ